MKSWICGSVLVILGLLATLCSAVVCGQIDWLHLIVIIFTLYSGLILLAALLERRRRGMKNDCYRPFVSCVVPALNEEDVIEATVRSLCGVQYRKNGKPNFEVVVVDDGSDDSTLDILHGLQQELPLLKVVERRLPDAGQGKAAALNHGLRVSGGDVIAVFDADTRVEPNFLIKSVACLYDRSVGGVQGRVRIYNSGQNMLTLAQDDEFSVLAHLVQMSKDVLDGMTALGGNGQLTRRSALQEVGGWNDLSTTEDLDLTVRLLLKGYSVRYCGDAVVWQEAVPDVKALLRQRVRWVEGFIKCLFDYAIPLMTRPISAFKRIDGLASLVRCLIPLLVLTAYLSVVLSLAMGTRYTNHVPWWLFAAASGIFFGITLVGIRVLQGLSLMHTLARVVLYWAYNFIWFFAVPMGFINCVKNINTIRWDKTEHRGDSPLIKLTNVPSMVYPLAEVVE